MAAGNFLLLLLTVSLRVLFFSFFFLLCFFFLDYLLGLQTISLCSAVFVCVTSGSPESDLDLELRGGGGGGGFLSLALSAFLPSAIIFSFFFFLPKLRGGGLGLSAHSPRSTTGLREVNFSLVFT